MSEDNSPGDDQAAPRQGPGDRLQSARISTGMTVEEVAGKMHLSTTILTSLEENNFEDITAPIFVKGYLRAYSRLVNENEDEIISQYTRFYMDGDPPISSTSNTMPEINADDSRVKWMTWLIILIIVSMLALWWWNRYQQAPETVSLDTSGKIDVAQNVNGQNNKELNKAEAVATDAELSLQQEPANIGEQLDAGMDGAPKTSYAPSLDSSNNSAVAPAQLATTEPEIELKQAPTEMLIETQSTQTAPTEQPVTRAPVEPQAAPEPPATEQGVQKGLKLTVNADTWASIKDANGKKLLKDLLRAGETVTLQGQPPISVFLGNGYGVSLSYNGEKIDFSDKIKSNNTAKFLIGK
jgi:cytoskeleton protein RodZ